MSVQFAKQFLGNNSPLADVIRVVNQMGDSLGAIFDSTTVQEQPILLRNVALASGTNQVAHTLGRKLTGWYLTRVRASATVYDTQDTQTLPNLYLALVASAPVTVDLLVF